MRKPILWLLGGMVLGSVMTAPVVAGAENINVMISNAKLLVNGVNKTLTNGSYWNGIAQVPVAFEYQGTTYVPVRYLSEALGIPVEWDGATRTIFVGNRPVDLFVPALSFGQSIRPEPNIPVTFTFLNSVLYDAGDSNLIKVTVSVRNDDTKEFGGVYQSQFVGKDGTQFTGSLYLPQGADTQVSPKTTRILQYYAAIPKGVSGDDLTLQLTKVDFNTYPAKFKPWVSVPLKIDETTAASYMAYDNPVFDLTPYQVQLGQIISWSYDYKALTQVYKMHATTTKQPDVNTYPSATELIFEVVDGYGQSVAQVRYAVGTSSNTAIPVLGDGDQYITFINLSWSRYNNAGTTIRVWEAFNQGKRLLGTFSIN